MDAVENLEAAIAMVEEARSVPLSASCVLNRSEMLQLLDQIKLSFPSDLAKAISILRDKDEILESAHKQADGVIAQARDEVARLVEQTTIVANARKEANRILAEANAANALSTLCSPATANFSSPIFLPVLEMLAVEVVGAK